MAGRAAIPLDVTDVHLPPGVRDVLRRAGTGWLKNTEVCDLLVHHRTYGLAVCRTAPVCPEGGTIFLFDRRAVRFFRKDGHSWRKKADGKTVRETHEKLKVGNADMLNCYYAHADEPEDVRLQRRCYWLLDADEDIVLVHYLSARQLTGGPRSKGAPARAAASQDTTSVEEDISERTTSSDGSARFAARRGASLESPFLTKARTASAAKQAAMAAAARAHRSAGGNGWVSGNNTSSRCSSGRTVSQHGSHHSSVPGSLNDSPHVAAAAAAARQHHQQLVYQQQLDPQLQQQQQHSQQHSQQQQQPEQMRSQAGSAGNLSQRTAAIAEVAGSHPAYNKPGKLRGGSSTLLPSMSIDSFLQFVEPPTLGSAVGITPDQAPKGARLTRQGSDPLRLESLANQGAVPMLAGHLPSLHMNPALTSSSIMLLKDFQDPLGSPPAGLAGSSLRLPSGLGSYEAFLKSNSGAGSGGRRVANLKALSGVIPKMQVITNSDRSSMDFETNRSFTVRPSSMEGDEAAMLGKLSGSWAAPGGRLPSWDQPLPPVSSSVPTLAPIRASPLQLHQGGQPPGSSAAPFYSPYAAKSPPRYPPSLRKQEAQHPRQPPLPGRSPHLLHSSAAPQMQHLQQQQQQLPQHLLQQQPRHPGTMSMQGSSNPSQAQHQAFLQMLQQQAVQQHQPPHSMQQQQQMQYQQLQQQRQGGSAMHPQSSAGPIISDDGRQQSDRLGLPIDMSPAASMVYLGSSADDVGGSKGVRATQQAAARSLLAIEADLSMLQQGMLDSWQAPPPGHGPIAPLGTNLDSWDSHLRALKDRSLNALARPGSGMGGGGGEASQHCFQVSDFTPEWDSTAGGAKLLLTGSMLPQAPPQAQRGPLYIMFDQLEVPATVVQPGVLKVTVPPHAPGTVKLAVSLGNSIPRSRSLSFQYRLPPPLSASQDDRVELQMSDREVQLRLVRMLLARRSDSEGGGSGATFEGGTGGDKSQQQQKQQQDTQQPGGMDASLQKLDALSDEHLAQKLALLLQREVHAHLTQVRESAAAGAALSSSLNHVPPEGLGLLHLLAALGQDWGLSAAGHAGADLEVRDPWGRTPLHWAAARGHEATVTALLRLNASPTVRTWSQEGRPAHSAADLAAAGGHPGLAAWLAQALLTRLLQGVSANRRVDAVACAATMDLDGADAAADRKRTRDARSLNPGDISEGDNIEARLEGERDPLQRAQQASAALATAHQHLVQRRATAAQRAHQLQSRKQAAAARIDQWAAVWQSAEGRTVGTTEQTVDYFRHLVVCASRLAAAIREQLLSGSDGEDDAEGDLAASIGLIDLGVPDCLQLIERAVAQVAAGQSDRGAAQQYQRLAAAAAAPLSHKFQRAAKEEDGPRLPPRLPASEPPLDAMRLHTPSLAHIGIAA